jgi:hypothetical protein
MASRARTLATAIVTALNAWGDLPAGTTAQRVRSVTHLIENLPESAPAVIAVIFADHEDLSNRADVADDITLGIVTIANCNSHEVSASDPWDDLTEKLADYLRSNAAFKDITVGTNVTAQRKKVNITVPCDADILDQNEVFVSVIQAAWFTSVGNH